MTSILKTLRAAADPTRLRILLVLEEEELSVAELQEILTLGQSTISSHLAQLKQAGLVEDRKAGKSSLYRILPGGGDGLLTAMLALADKEVPEAAADQAEMRRVVKKRQERMRSFFDEMAGRLGKDYVPGKSWKSLVVALLRLLPPTTVADLGAGDGSLALLFSQTAQHVIAVDSSAKMLEVAREQAARQGVRNVDFRQGDVEELPIESGSVELAFFSQSLHHALHPKRALAEAFRILKAGGRVVVLDLAKHRFEEARELYADEWLGFGEAELEQMLTEAGFSKPEVAVVDRDPDAPQFQTLLGIAVKPQ
ncbi:ArsR/SmtB family transcription factor [Occallatibacter riparius]|uniref:Metalloregulator ArsR/SmtB family transcription factor n=1 Tax=Occallatibacter riparius TaxID=1002689 RepID=A0A9J7BWJ1_9BACT|nr:metalloregulator ArsR/SmtB family transcription factor [Occallatibacter riparius]UWZ86178.1 metalloregulator ArsR/SmtB family transcription factor [Occallatibacter riparius]